MKQILDFLKRMGFTQAFCLYVITLCFGYFFWLSKISVSGKPVPNEISEIKICIIGIAGSIVGYIVGSSKSSRDKDKSIADAIKGNQSEETTTT